ncbi:MAG: cytochrome b [Zoogloea sp.]|jgi:cytochrome b561|nr:cytochrome b [Zoogloea sp.]
MNTASQRYSGPAIAAHWIIALLILAAWPLGAYMHELPLSPTKLKLYSYHKWIGITVLLLFVPRILWRITHRPPAALPMPAWQHKIAEGVHHLLYLLMVLVPLSGWLMSSAKGFQVVYFGVLPLPDLVAKSEELGDLLKEVHEVLNFGLLALVGLHVAGALKHHIIDRDATLRRMLPFGK